MVRFGTVSEPFWNVLGWFCTGLAGGVVRECWLFEWIATVAGGVLNYEL